MTRASRVVFGQKEAEQHCWRGTRIHWIISMILLFRPEKCSNTRGDFTYLRRILLISSGHQRTTQVYAEICRSHECMRQKNSINPSARFEIVCVINTETAQLNRKPQDITPFVATSNDAEEISSRMMLCGRWTSPRPHAIRCATDILHSISFRG
jgi:hypothetical protein